MVAAGHDITPEALPAAASRLDVAAVVGNPRRMQTLLGHSSVATTERYTAVDDDEIRAAMLAAIG